MITGLKTPYKILGQLSSYHQREALESIEEGGVKYYDVFLVENSRLVDDRTFKSIERVREYLEALVSLGYDGLKWHVYFGDGRALVFLRNEDFRKRFYEGEVCVETFRNVEFYDIEVFERDYYYVISGVK